MLVPVLLNVTLFSPTFSARSWPWSSDFVRLLRAPFWVTHTPLTLKIVQQNVIYSLDEYRTQCYCQVVKDERIETWESSSIRDDQVQSNGYNHILHETHTTPRCTNKRPPGPCDVARFRCGKEVTTVSGGGRGAERRRKQRVQRCWFTICLQECIKIKAT